MRHVPFRRVFVSIIALTISAFGIPAFAVVPGQLDNFEDGTTQGWGEGTGVITPNPNPPTNEPTGGPDGANDNFLQNVSTGVGTAGSKQLIINTTQWAGDYISAGVSGVRLQAKVIAGTQADLRIALMSAAGTRYASTEAVVVTNDGAWHEVLLPVTPQNLTNVGGFESAEQVLASVATVRIVSAAFGPAWNGDTIALTVGYDNIEAVGAAVPFRGWLWSNSVYNSSLPDLAEEYCFGRLDLQIDAGNTWNAQSPKEVCWGRELVNTPSPRSYFNFDGATFPSSEPFESRSTRPLVAAGSNLFELYGEDVIGGVGQGESRLATVLSEPSGGDLLMIGGFFGFNDLSFSESLAFVHLLVTSSTDDAAARTPAAMQGLWRITFFERLLNRVTPSIESSRAMVHTVDLQAGGVCAFVESGVFQAPDVNTNGDLFNIVLSDLDASNLTNQRVNAAVFDRSISNCSYSIDGNGYLVLAYTQSDVGGVVARTAEFVVSDDNNYLLAAGDPVDDASSPNALVVGYRAASAMNNAALDGNFLFYLNFTEYSATGTGSSQGGTGPQQFDGHGRGMISFDSSTPGSTPVGQTGDWRVCDVDLVLDQTEYQADGDPGQLQVSTSMAVVSESLRFSSCDYRLDADGSLLISLGVGGPGETVLFEGYVSENGEVISLVNFFSEPEPDIFAGEDQAAVRHILGLRYIGDPLANADGDEFSNVQEFLLPLPPPPTGSCSLSPLPAVCALPDMNGNGSNDVAVVDTVGANTRVRIRDGASDVLISDIDFGTDTAHAADVIQDLDANGSLEIAVLNTQPSGQVRVQVRDSSTGNIVRNLFYGATYSATTMRVVGDYSGNGAPEIAVMGSDATDAIRVQLKDAGSGTTLDNVFLGTQGIGRDFLAVSDTSGNSVPELAILSVLKGNDQVRTQVWDAADATFQTNVWFGKVYQPYKLMTMPDINANGSDEIVAIGVDPATQNIRVQVRDSASTITHYNIWLGNTNQAVDVALINDINGNGSPDLAILLKTPTGTGRVRVQDGLNGAFIRNLFYTVVTNPAGLAVMPDYSGNGFEELAVLGESAGVRHVQILDTVSGSQVNRIDYP